MEAFASKRRFNASTYVAEGQQRRSADSVTVSFVLTPDDTYAFGVPEFCKESILLVFLCCCAIADVELPLCEGSELLKRLVELFRNGPLFKEELAKAEHDYLDRTLNIGFEDDSPMKRMLMKDAFHRLNIKKNVMIYRFLFGVFLDLSSTQPLKVHDHARVIRTAKGLVNLSIPGFGKEFNLDDEGGKSFDKFLEIVVKNLLDEKGYFHLDNESHDMHRRLALLLSYNFGGSKNDSDDMFSLVVVAVVLSHLPQLREFEKTRIIVGSQEASVGQYSAFFNSCFVMQDSRFLVRNVPKPPANDGSNSFVDRIVPSSPPSDTASKAFWRFVFNKNPPNSVIRNINVSSFLSSPVATESLSSPSPLSLILYNLSCVLTVFTRSRDAPPTLAPETFGVYPPTNSRRNQEKVRRSLLMYVNGGDSD